MHACCFSFFIKTIRMTTTTTPSTTMNHHHHRQQQQQQQQQQQEGSASNTVTDATDATDATVVLVTTDNTMELLAELNNEGASHLENSMFVEAISTLTSALSIAMKEEDNTASSSSSSSGGTSTTTTTTNSNRNSSNDITEHGSVASQLRAAVAEIPTSGVPPIATAVAAATTTTAIRGSGTSKPIREEEEEDDTSPPAAAAKPKKTRRRKHKRRNSFGSTGSKEVASSRPSRNRESRRHHRTNHPNNNNNTSSPHPQRRRARSAMGRLTGQGDVVVITEDILQVPHKHVYAKPLRVMDRYQIPSSIELAIYVVYNLALAYQLQALSSSAAASNSLGESSFPRSKQGASTWSRITKLYKLASDLLEQQQQHLEETEDAIVDPHSPLWSPTYTVALPNNLACAYHSTGNDAEASIHWQQALTHLWCILDVLGGTSQVECFSEVFENAAHLMDQCPIGRTATAA